jgi:hypothetical protein
MVAISIMGIAIVTIVTSMGAGILLSTRHRQQANAHTALVSSAEWVKAQEFAPCPASYSPPAMNGYQATTSVAYTDDTGATVACGDATIQVVTITVPAPSGYAPSVSVVKRTTAYDNIPSP